MLPGADIEHGAVRRPFGFACGGRRIHRRWLSGDGCAVSFCAVRVCGGYRGGSGAAVSRTPADGDLSGRHVVGTDAVAGAGEGHIQGPVVQGVGEFQASVWTGRAGAAAGSGGRAVAAGGGGERSTELEQRIDGRRTSAGDVAGVLGRESAAGASAGGVEGEAAGGAVEREDRSVWECAGERSGSVRVGGGASRWRWRRVAVGGDAAAGRVRVGTVPADE